MAEPEGTVETPTAPAPVPEAETQNVEITTQETPTPLTLDTVKALITETFAEYKTAIGKDVEQTYKTLRRGEAKSDVAHQRIAKLEGKLEDLATRGMAPEEVRIWKLERQVERDAEARAQTANPDVELSAFESDATSILEEESIDRKDPVLNEAFQRFANGWRSSADLKVALTRAVAAVHKEREQTARTESAEREKKAREDERTKLRNEKRQSEGPVDKGTPASPVRSKHPLEMTEEELRTLIASQRRR